MGTSVTNHEDVYSLQCTFHSIDCIHVHPLSTQCSLNGQHKFVDRDLKVLLEIKKYRNKLDKKRENEE